MRITLQRLQSESYLDCLIERMRDCQNDAHPILHGCIEEMRNLLSEAAELIVAMRVAAAPEYRQTPAPPPAPPNETFESGWFVHGR